MHPETTRSSDAQNNDNGPIWQYSPLRSARLIHGRGIVSRDHGPLFPAIRTGRIGTPATGASLLDLFPSIKASVLLDISRHDFEPSDLYKLDSKYRDKASRSVLDFNGRTFSLRDPTTKEYPSFHALFAPLMTYFNILAAFAATSGNSAAVYQVSSGGSLYMTQLEQFTEDYQWSAVLAYHMEFHHKRRRDMIRGDYSAWGLIDSALQAKHLNGRDRARFTASNARGPSKAHSGSSPSGSPRTDMSSEVCNLFNRGVCTSPCRYKRQHKCNDCNASDHGQHNCPKKST
ncbi:hypothetical protein C2E23DRAFT_949406 [Lenzites betulinus]|nr:hypothetical protein C2E23DRAFT_949406 [Lenzites betulinus]